MADPRNYLIEHLQSRLLRLSPAEVWELRNLVANVHNLPPPPSVKGLFQ